MSWNKEKMEVINDPLDQTRSHASSNVTSICKLVYCKILKSEVRERVKITITSGRDCELA